MKNLNSEKATQIVSSAVNVFLRYGFRRVTMADLAEAAKMSRPALYLEFSSKEDIFVAVVDKLSRQNLEDIQRELTKSKTLDSRLEVAFEIWFVRPFELIQSSPDAADLFDSVKEFASEVIERAALDFENLLVEILDPSVQKRPALKLTARQLARILRISAKAFKSEAKSAGELRDMIRDMRRLVLANVK